MRRVHHNLGRGSTHRVDQLCFYRGGGGQTLRGTEDEFLSVHGDFQNIKTIKKLTLFDSFDYLISKTVS